MRTLFIDLASHSGLIACVTDEKIISSIETDHRISDAELIPTIENLLREAGWTYQDLTQIACVTGPGGFTSLRVAVAYTNVLADQLKIPLAGIHLSDLYFARAKNKKIYWLHSTKKEELFIRGGKWKESTLISLTEAAALPKNSLWMGELIPHHREILLNLSEDQESAGPPRFLSKYLVTLAFHNQMLHPWYGRSW